MHSSSPRRRPMRGPEWRAIHAALQQAWVTPRPGGLSLRAAFSDACTDTAQVAERLWALEQFRPAERERWDALQSAAIARVQQAAEQALLEALADALATFTTEHPEAPRSGAGRGSP